ncbi:MAG: GntR family transcriptional regulator [Anaerolineae bacterium]|nr:GntR family transcriptional regulator [Anaerolineae bacterium]
MLQRKPSLTEQAKAYIKQRIIDGAFPGDRIPAETELAAELGVSRTTIRDALSRLENEGVVYRRQGSGTFVNEPGLQIKIRLEEIWSYEAVLEAHGYTPATRILDVDTAPANSREAELLQIETGAPLITVRKLFLEDEEPVILAVNQVPAVTIAEPYEPDDWKQPIFEFLSAFGREHLAYYLSEIVPLVVDGTLARTLRVRPGTALLSFAEVGYNDENNPILLTQSYIRDDLLRLRLIRRQA